MSARIPKQTFYAIVEQSYRDGIGARRLSQLIGYSYAHIRIAARTLGMPKLPRTTRSKNPSLALLTLIGSVAHLRIAPGAKVGCNKGSTRTPIANAEPG